MNRFRHLFPLLITTACGVAEPEPQQTIEDPATTFTTSQPSFSCEEPDEITVPPYAEDLVFGSPGPSVVNALVTNGEETSVDFSPTAPRTFTSSIKVITSLEKDDATRTLATLDTKTAALDVRVQKTTVTRRTSGTRVTLSTQGTAIQDVDLVVTYVFAPVNRSNGIGVTTLQLVNRTSGATLDQHSPGLVLTDVPGSCKETALVIHGPFAWDMPALKWPEIEDCTGDQCVSVALSWLHLHHNVWRAEQMFAVLENVNAAQRSYAWGRPGTDELGDAVSMRSSPSYWLGGYDNDRYDAYREVIHKYGDITRTAKIGPTKIHLQCPVYSDNPGNVCFNSDASGHHWVRGWINFCDSAFDGPPSNSINHFPHEVMHHEPLHHVFVHFNGLRMLRDTFTHGHGNLCLSNLSTGPVYGEDEVRHFVTEGGSCGHVDKLPRMVDAYAQFILTIGEMVRTGEMTHWPKWGDPTPQPPECVGGIGCLCSDTQFNESPDGDYRDDKYCEDNEGLAVCMETTFNASDTVGVCTLCDELRGPGCPCNDVEEPCEQGFCFGDDTNGLAAGTGTCYMADPPAWACLADCERLLGNGAFCMNEHPEHGRCVPVGTTTPEATLCWEAGGHMDPQELECTYAEECINSNDCHELGYPTYFTCDNTLRCVPNP